MITNGMGIQVAIAYPKKISKAMEYFNENGSHPLLSSKVFLPFVKSAAIDNNIFRKLIRMQNEYICYTKHAEMHNLCHIDKDISL
jgi:hypothetical protein